MRRNNRCPSLPSLGAFRLFALSLALLTSSEARALPLAASVTEVSAGTSAEFVIFLSDLGLYPAAMQELQRLDAAGQLPWLQPGLGYDFGHRLLAEGQPSLAATFLEQAVQADPEPLRALGQTPLLALALAAAGQTARAVHLLGQVEDLSTDVTEVAMAQRLRCVLHLQGAQEEMGRACSLKLLGDAVDSVALERLSLRPDRQRWIGGALSAALPGLGQLLAGEPEQAGAALVVNGGFIWLNAALFAEHAWLGGAFLITGVTGRYYAGNIAAGARAWEQKATRDRQRAGRRLVEQLVALPSPGVHSK